MGRQTIEDISVEVCSGGCGGIWFDGTEVQKLNELHESAGETLLDVKKVPHVVEHSTPSSCPKCDNATMIRLLSCPDKQVVVDECPSCRGVWLDYGELRQIQTQFESEEERAAAVENYFSEIFGVELEKMRTGGEEKAKALALLFRFVCPSYYIPGEQDWGAF